MPSKQPLGIELVKRKIVSGEDIERALKYQETHRSRRIGDILYILKAAEPNILAQNVGEILGKKAVYLDINKIKIEPTDYIPFDIMKKNKAIPFAVESGKIKIAFADIANNDANIKSIKMLMLNKGLVVDVYIAFQTNVEEFLDKYDEKNTQQDIEEMSGNETTTEIVDNIIKLAIEKRASDIHIEPQSDSVRVRYRIDGELFVMTNIPKERQAQLIGRLKAISNMHQEITESQDGRILLYPDYNIRVSSQKNIYGEKFVLRLLKKNSNIKNIFELGYPYDEEQLEKTINKRNCLTIIAAPTGEGKTTTLYSFLDYLKSDNINITTIEDPVEIRIPGLNQIEVEKNSTFSDNLRTILRQDPDVILVGEIRDKETAEIAIQAGQTGHYVLSTIHTIDAVEVLTRLRKIGVSDYDIASTVATTISQRLVRKLCPKCRRERDFDKREIDFIKKIGEKYGIEFNLKDAKTYDAVGCDYCNGSGYYDRIALFEVLSITEELKEMIMAGKSSIEVRKKALEQDYRPLLIDGINKAIAGITNFDELNRKLLIYNQ